MDRKLEFKINDEKMIYIYKKLKKIRENSKCPENFDFKKAFKKSRENTKYPENFDFEKALTEIFNKLPPSYSTLTNSSDIIEECRVNPDTRMLEIKWNPKVREELCEVGMDKNIKLPFEIKK